MSQKINPNVEKSYRMGEPIFFYDEKKKHWRRGTALIRYGKTVYIRFGNFLRRVPVEKVRHDMHGEFQIEEGYAEHDDEATEREEFKSEMSKEIKEDIGLAEENDKLKKELCEQKKLMVKERDKVIEGRKMK